MDDRFFYVTICKRSRIKKSVIICVGTKICEMESACTHSRCAYVRRANMINKICWQAPKGISKPPKPIILIKLKHRRISTLKSDILLHRCPTKYNAQRSARYLYLFLFFTANTFLRLSFARLYVRSYIRRPFINLHNIRFNFIFIPRKFT